MITDKLKIDVDASSFEAARDDLLEQICYGLADALIDSGIARCPGARHDRRIQIAEAVMQALREHSVP